MRAPVAAIQATFILSIKGIRQNVSFGQFRLVSHNMLDENRDQIVESCYRKDNPVVSWHSHTISSVNNDESHIANLDHKNHFYHSDTVDNNNEQTVV